MVTVGPVSQNPVKRNRGRARYILVGTVDTAGSLPIIRAGTVFPNMMDAQKLKDAVERAADDAISRQLSALRCAIVDAVVQELNSSAQAEQGASTADVLNAAVASIQDVNAQSDILNALLNGAEKFSGRTGLLVVRGATASGWQARGFDPDGFRRAQINVGAGLAERAIRTQTPAAGSAHEFESSFVNQFGAPAEGNCVVLPLVVRERVAALLYADAGDADAVSMNVSALELLVRSASLWLEVLALRKSMEQPAPQPVQQHVQPPAAQEAVAAAASASAGAPAAATSWSQPQPPVPTPEASPAPPSGESEIHSKARRFAKLLVEEIKLYNQGKVNDGRQNRDLYDRLRDDIEKSRAAYQKRFGDAVAEVDFFSSELIRVLAEDNRELLGANYPG